MMPVQRVCSDEGFLFDVKDFLGKLSEELILAKPSALHAYYNPLLAAKSCTLEAPFRACHGS